MRRFFYFLFFAFLLAFFSKTYAYGSENYFDFQTDDYITNYLHELNINFSFKLPKEIEKRFIVRPSALGARVDIENSTYAETDPTAEIEPIPYLWSSFPILSKNLKIKVSGNFDKTELRFEILDTKTGRIYKTQSKEIWNNSIFDSYREKLNKNIVKW